MRPRRWSICVVRCWRSSTAGRDLGEGGGGPGVDLGVAADARGGPPAVGDRRKEFGDGGGWRGRGGGPWFGRRPGAAVAGAGGRSEGAGRWWLMAWAGLKSLIRDAVRSHQSAVPPASERGALGVVRRGLSLRPAGRRVSRASPGPGLSAASGRGVADLVAADGPRGGQDPGGRGVGASSGGIRPVRPAGAGRGDGGRRP